VKKNRFISYRSPAKINLFFKVLFKRNDNFHEIFSLIQAIDLFDFLHIRVSEKNRFRSNVFLKDNTILKAFELFKKKVNLDVKLDIVLEKNIPMESGLGGGSGNAATLLFALNEMFSKGLSREELMELGAEIGSDVPFFFSFGRALCFGRGEKVEEVKKLDESFVIAKPFFGMSTKRVYENLKLKEKVDCKGVLKEYEKNGFFNDLEKSVLSLNKELFHKKELLKTFSKNVCMTGSGSAFFFKSKKVFKSSEDFEFYNVKSVYRNFNSWYT
jgi:4-diphosphocytidyl-2-C-methyl-D-erythritol kinase